MLSLSYASEDWKWRWRVALLFILAHMIVFILPFFSMIFLLMECLGEGQNHGKLAVGRVRGISFVPIIALVECCILITLIGIFFFQMLTMFVQPFSKLVLSEVLLLGAYIFVSETSDGLFHIDNIGDINHTHIPLIITLVCMVIKVFCAYSSQSMEDTKRILLKRGPGKIV